MKLYVGNLNYKVEEDELLNLFESVGEVVSCRILTDKFTGRSRGFGFVEMGSDSLGRDAIERFHDADFGGRKLVVNEARERESAPRRGGNSFSH